jgi:hypothetical protein
VLREKEGVNLGKKMRRYTENGYINIRIVPVENRVVYSQAGQETCCLGFTDIHPWATGMKESKQ